MTRSLIFLTAANGIFILFVNSKHSLSKVFYLFYILFFLKEFLLSGFLYRGQIKKSVKLYVVLQAKLYLKLIVNKASSKCWEEKHLLRVVRDYRCRCVLTSQNK